MSIKIKVVVILIAVIVFSTMATIAINHYFLFPSFLSLERMEAEKNMRRPSQAILREIHHLSSLVHDWSAWDDTYEYVVTESQDYVDENIPISSFIDNQLNLICICNANGKVIYKKGYSFETETLIDIPEIPDDAFPKDHRLTTFPESGAPLSEVEVSGILLTARYPMLIASRPVLTNDNTGPIRGSLIMGRYLTDTVKNNLSKQTEVPFEAVPINRTLHETFIDTPVLSVIKGMSTSYIDLESPDQLKTYTMLTDIFGAPALLLTVTIKREITQKGSLSMKYIIISSIILGVLVFSAIVVLLHAVIIRPVSILAEHALTIGETGDLSSRLNFKRNDEIGRLAHKLDKMLEQLDEARTRLLEQTYYSGLAGMTSDIIHNAGNILMPVSLNITTLLEKCRAIPFDTIDRAMKELKEDTADSSRKQSLLAYMDLSVNDMKETLQENKAQLETISGHFAEIEKVLIDLEEYSRSGMISEAVLLDDIVSNAISIMPRKLKKQITIAINPDIKTLPRIIGERIVLIQVFGTILNTAAELAASHAEDGAELSVSGHYDKGVAHEHYTRIHITVNFNGPALTGEMVRNMFSRGYTMDGQSKHLTGLHWCSNVVTAMNGSLSADARESGKGSYFHLTLPAKDTE